MNSTERVRNTILGKPVDRQPIYGWVFTNLTEQISKEWGSVEAFEDAYEFECQDFKLIISEDIYDDDTIEYAKKIVNKYLTDKDSILNYMLEVGLRDFYKNNFKYSDEYIKKEIGKPQIIINFKKDDKHPQWKFEYSGIIDFCESNLDEHLISIEFSDELLLDDNVQINEKKKKIIMEKKKWKIKLKI